MSTTRTSGSWTSDMCFIYQTVNAVFRLFLGWATTLLLRPSVMTDAGSSARPSCICSLGAIKMVVTLQLMRAHMQCMSPLPTLLQTSWIIWDVSSLDVPHKYWLDMRGFGLSNNTLEIEAIQCGCMLSIVSIKVCIANLSKPKSASSNLSWQARCQERPMSFLAVDCGRTSVVWFGVPHPCWELVSGPAVAVEYLLMSI